MWKVFVVDDDPHVLKGLRGFLQAAGQDIQWVGEAGDGQEALACIRLLAPDIVITDIRLPVMTGLEMIEALFAMHFAGAFIILSGYADFRFAQQALRFGVDDYLLKPATLSEMRAVLDKTIRRLEADRASERRRKEDQKRLIAYEPLIRSEWMRMIAAGTVTDELIEQGIPFLEQRYWVDCVHRVLCLTVQDAGSVSLKAWKEMRGRLESELEAAAQDGEGEAEYIPLYSNAGAVLFHLPADMNEEASAALCLAAGERMAARAMETLGVSLRYALGGLKHNWWEIADSTEEAFLCLRQAGAPGPVRREMVQPEVSIRRVQFYTALTDAVVYTDKEAARTVIEAFLAQMRSENGRLTPRFLQDTAAELLAVLRYSLHSAGVLADTSALENGARERTGGIDSVESFERWLLLVLRGVDEGRDFRRNTKHGDTVQHMLQYIADHFAEDITLDDLAGQLHLSRNHLNQIFKNAVGETFTNHLIRVRMETARKLLLESKLYVYEIAERVGYRNVPYFSNLFKKYYQIKPSDVGKR